jgi:S-adenosylmethionine hydrolase
MEVAMRGKGFWLALAAAGAAAGLVAGAGSPVLAKPTAQRARAALPRTAPLVLMTDFGVKDGAVSAVKGVAYGVSPKLLISDLSHEIDGIWDGAYRLYQVAPYWPKGTVFVTVIDPGVGTARKSIVARTRAGHYYVGPDNGLYTLIDEAEGIDAVRVIDETVNRLPGSQNSNTFHGRDVFGYTGARLASGTITFDQVGPLADPAKLVRLSYQRAVVEGGTLKGMIPVLDIQYGNVWTNIPRAMVAQAGLKVGDRVTVDILHDGKVVDSVTAPFTRTFGDVPVGAPMVYINSLLNLSVALNQGNYAKDHGIGWGPGWSVRVKKGE